MLLGTYVSWVLIGAGCILGAVFVAGCVSGLVKEWAFLHGTGAVDEDGAIRVQSFGLLLSHMAIAAVVGGVGVLYWFDKPLWPWSPALLACGGGVSWYARAAVSRRLRDSSAHGGSDRRI